MSPDRTALNIALRLTDEEHDRLWPFSRALGVCSGKPLTRARWATMRPEEFAMLTNFIALDLLDHDGVITDLGEAVVAIVDEAMKAASEAMFAAAELSEQARELDKLDAACRRRPAHRPKPPASYEDPALG